MAVLLWVLAVVGPSHTAVRAESGTAALVDFVSGELAAATALSYDGFVAYRGLIGADGESFLAGCGPSVPRSDELPDGTYRAQVVLRYWSAETGGGDEDPSRWFSFRFGVQMVDARATDWHHLENRYPSQEHATDDWAALSEAPLPILDSALLPNELFSALLEPLLDRREKSEDLGYSLLKRLCAPSSMEGGTDAPGAAYLSVNAELDALTSPEIAPGEYLVHLRNVLRFVDPRASPGDADREEFVKWLGEVVPVQEVFAAAGFINKDEQGGEAVADRKEAELYGAFRRGVEAGLARISSLALAPETPADMQDQGAAAARPPVSPSEQESTGSSALIFGLAIFVLAILGCGIYGGILIRRQRPPRHRKPGDTQADGREADSVEESRDEPPGSRAPINETFSESLYEGMEKGTNAAADRSCESLILENLRGSKTALEHYPQERSSRSDDEVRSVLSASGRIAGILSGQLDQMRAKLDDLKKIADELSESLNRIEEADPHPTAGPGRREAPDAGNLVNLEDPDNGEALRRFLDDHCGRLGFMRRGEVQDEVRRQVDDAVRRAITTQGRRETTAEPDPALRDAPDIVAPEADEPVKVSREHFHEKIRQLSELGVHEPGIERASRELERIIKTSEGRLDAILGRFGKYMVDEMLPTGERDAYYSRFSAWFEDFSGRRACLIVPAKGEGLDTRRCVSVGRQPTSAGPMEAIIRTERPGVMVKDEVVIRARVLTT